MPELQAQLTFWRLNSPSFQNLICSIVLGLSPGIFTALAALGNGGGKASSTHVASVVNSSLYAIYTISGWIASMLLNTIGPRWTLTLARYHWLPLLHRSILVLGKTGQEWFPILSGLILGLSAGWLWSTGGWISVAYSTENQRGLFVSVQIIMTGIGATLSNIIAFVLVYAHPQAAGAVPSSVYATFLALNILSIFVAAVFMIDPSKIVRNDGTSLALFSDSAKTTGIAEFKGLISILKDWRVLALIPVMFATELPIGIQTSLNAYAFNIRTRTLLGVSYSVAQILVAFIFMPVMDNPKRRRRSRGLLGIFMLSIICLGSWISELGWMNGKRLNRKDIDPLYDWSDGLSFGGFAVIYAMFSALYVTYLLVCLDPVVTVELSHNLGKICGDFQRNGRRSVVFGVDSIPPPFYSEYYAFGLQALGLAIMAFLCLTQVSDSNYFKEADVYAPIWNPSASR
ncbi:putative membrane protein [Mycena venus]|uniref:Putative membrane protein n=1 Tax=Mycena venus TaxID=2733690 RepID=A0A8H7CXQ6_9AGAR|nr:putative membrane protein [Mycena venus]